MDMYHGILVNLSQRNRSIFRESCIVGHKNFFLGLLVLYKIEVAPQYLDPLIRRIQANMADRVALLHKEFYCHFYRDDELVIVFRQKLFRVTTDPGTWSQASAYGRSIGIARSQLDFSPCRIEDESF
jgi:hypothetical protein